MALIKPFLVIASNQTTCFAERNVTIGQSPCQDVDAVINVATDPSLPADIGELRGAGSLATRSCGTRRHRERHFRLRSIERFRDEVEPCAGHVLDGTGAV